MNHHYIPQFYLREWQNPQQFYRYSVIYHCVHHKSTCAVSEGYEPGLYALRHVPREERDKIERECFGDIDNKAAILLKTIETKGIAHLSNQDKIEWTRFIYSMISRYPKIIGDAKISATKIFDNGFKKLSISEQQRYKEPHEKLKVNAGITTIAEMLTPNNSSNLKQLENFQNALLEMFWFIDDFSQTSPALLTSDKPVCLVPIDLKTSQPMNDTSLSNILLSKKFFIYFPISPHKAFFAFPTNVFEPALGNMETVIFFNNRIVNNAVEYVYAKDNSQRTLVEKILLTKHYKNCNRCNEANHDLCHL